MSLPIHRCASCDHTDAKGECRIDPRRRVRELHLAGPEVVDRPVVASCSHYEPTAPIRLELDAIERLEERCDDIEAAGGDGSQYRDAILEHWHAVKRLLT